CSSWTTSSPFGSRVTRPPRTTGKGPSRTHSAGHGEGLSQGLHVSRQTIHREQYHRVIAKSHFRNGGANLQVCRGAQQGAAHHFGNDFWQSLLGEQPSRLSPQATRPRGVLPRRRPARPRHPPYQL